MILATHGVIRRGGGFDADAQAFFNRVTAAGGSLTTTEQNAVNQLVLDLKANSLWTPMKAIYPMVGGSAAACAQNLKSSSFTGTFSSGWTFASTGATPNGTSAYMDTGFNMTTNFTSQSNASIGCYLRTNTNTTGCDMGAGGVSGATNGMLLYSSFAGTTFYHCGMRLGSSDAANSNSTQFYCVVSDGADNIGYKRGSNNISKTTTLTLASLQSLNIYVGAGNPATGNTSFLYSNRQTAFNFIGDKLTSTDVDNYSTLVTTFQTALSRNV